MLEDEFLKLRFIRGDSGALGAIYDKYADYLLTLAGALLNDHGLAEDVLGDVFVSFAGRFSSFRLRGSLKAYLTKSVINRSRDYMRKRKFAVVSLDGAELPVSSAAGPLSEMVLEEQCAQLTAALQQLGEEQREVVVLKVKAGLKFRQIAALQGVSVNTAQGRYRYGIDKLRSILDDEAEK